MNNSLAVIIILLIVFIAISIINTQRYNKSITDYLHGLWVSDDDFCAQAGIDGILLYIGEENTTLLQNIHKAYLIIHADGQILDERRITITYYKHFVSLLYDSNPIINITIEDANGEPSSINMDDIMPNQLSLDLNMNSGCMYWSNDDTVYAKLYKDSKASH